jgi:predicted DCC family thiol-disulfide oxidoreductase YuxK
LSVNTEITDKTKREATGWVLYDGRCGFCSAGVRRAAPVLKTVGLVLLPVQAPWAVRQLKLTRGTRSAEGEPAGHRDRVPGEIALLTRDGRLIGGVDAYLYIAERLWWARPLGRLGRLGPIHRLLHIVYAWIAGHRQQISAACRLDADLPPETEVGDDRRLLH